MALTLKERKARYWRKHRDDPEFRAREYAHVERWRIQKRDEGDYNHRYRDAIVAWRQRNRAKLVEASRKWQLANPEKVRAHKKLQYAVRCGKLVPPTHCPQCGNPPKRGRLEAHHADYSNPLEVLWLCHQCHGKTWRTR